MRRVYWRTWLRRLLRRREPVYPTQNKGVSFYPPHLSGTVDELLERLKQ